MNWRYFLLFFLILPVLWGCPTRRLVPDPIPPEPKVNVSLTWRQLELLGGMAPPVGSRPYFVEMLASHAKPIEKNLPLTDSSCRVV